MWSDSLDALERRLEENPEPHPREDPEGDELVFELAGTDDGTLLTFTTLLAERDTAAKVAAGWDACLDALTGSPDTDWSPLYDAYVAADVPSGSPIPGGRPA